jgi:hypothetical protein
VKTFGANLMDFNLLIYISTYNSHKSGKIPRTINQENGVFVILKCFHEMFCNCEEIPEGCTKIKFWREFPLRQNRVNRKEKKHFSCRKDILLKQYQFIVCPRFLAFDTISPQYYYSRRELPYFTLLKCVIKNVLRMKSAGELAQTLILYFMAYKGTERVK